MKAALIVGALSLAAAVLPASRAEATRNLVFLAEERPVFLRLRVTSLEKPFEDGWPESIRLLLTSLDRDTNGKLSAREANNEALSALIRLATGNPTSAASLNLGIPPEEGAFSIDVMVEKFRPILPPFRIQSARLASGRTDALFDQLDRDKDGQLTKTELGTITGSLRRLDLDDNQVISTYELEPYNDPSSMALVESNAARKASYTAIPSVIEVIPSESSLRLARLLLKKYDLGKGETPARPNNKLSPEEFAIDAEAFIKADKNGDGSLTTEELRGYVANSPVDLVLDVAFAAKSNEGPHARLSSSVKMPKGVTVRPLGEGDLEIGVGHVRLDIHADGGEALAREARRVLAQRFDVADKNKDGYLEGKELASENAPGSPLAGLVGIIDRDRDGKLYAKEMNAFLDAQLESARGRMVLNASDLGRSIFGILDLDRDRRLGTREIMRTVDRALTWDSDGDGRISADEIPYYFRVTISRGGLSGLTGEGNPGAAGVPSMESPRLASPSAGPEWFRKMDRNHDGDVSRREFLGSIDQFNRLDRDGDALIDAEEASAAKSSAKNP